MNKKEHFTQIFREFRKKYARATDYFLKIYDIGEDYVIYKYLIFPSNSKLDRRYMGWYWFKKAVKLIEKNKYYSTPSNLSKAAIREWFTNLINHKILNKCLP